MIRKSSWGQSEFGQFAGAPQAESRPDGTELTSPHGLGATTRIFCCRIYRGALLTKPPRATLLCVTACRGLRQPRVSLLLSNMNGHRQKILFVCARNKI